MKKLCLMYSSFPLFLSQLHISSLPLKLYEKIREGNEEQPEKLIQKKAAYSVATQRKSHHHSSANTTYTTIIKQKPIQMSNCTISNSIITSNSHQHHHSRISNGTQACAACKYQRRKCASDCALAPYFPHDRQRQFLNAHKLFGVSNITKIIRNLNPPDKDIAMRTIIYQSDARAKDPVGGCYRIIRELHHQIAYCKAELDLVLQQLELCKAQVYQQQHAQLYQIATGLTPQPLDPDSQVDAGTASTPVADNNNNNQQGTEILTCDNDSYQQYQALMRCYYYDEAEQGNNNEQPYIPISQQQQVQDQNDQYSWVAPPNDDAVLASSNSSTSHGDCFVMKNDFGSECDGLEMKPQIQIVANGAPYDDEKEYGSKFDESSTHVDLSCCDLQGDGLKFDHQQTTELSEEAALKEENIVLRNPEDESFHHISEHDLRNAATLFTLTN
ncbi:LOB domain-containing protein 27-like [Chenopodium quinoa]|uniref:LOB domain-containing protein 27-like n=1 Tax=Chenopodium quinoa TaxID=63459 RepID=UPI000B776EBF|nr:LOB domain-containing protein 27-like [Chenopodium quinoa]